MGEARSIRLGTGMMDFGLWASPREKGESYTQMKTSMKGSGTRESGTAMGSSRSEMGITSRGTG